MQFERGKCQLTPDFIDCPSHFGEAVDNGGNHRAGPTISMVIEQPPLSRGRRSQCGDELLTILGLKVQAARI